MDKKECDLENIDPLIREEYENAPGIDEVLAEFGEDEDTDLFFDPEIVVGVTKAMIVEDILVAMEEDGVTRSELAERMGKSRQYVSRILNETANFTLETLARISCALERDLFVRLAPRGTTLRFEKNPKSNVDSKENASRVAEESTTYGKE
ncbi:MAG: helix-turn-helix transcriptional regulator [Candidatus Sumerlaeota bacterium]